MWHDAQASGGFARRHGGGGVAAAYLSDAWHCRQTPSPASAQLGAVRLMAIAAGDAGREHLALLERAVVVDLVEHLPVGMIEPARKRRDRMRVGQPPAREPNPRRTAPRRAWHRPQVSTSLRSVGGREAARRVAGRADRSARRRRAARRSGPAAPCADRRSCRTATSSAARAPSRRAASPGRGRPRSRR